MKHKIATCLIVAALLCGLCACATAELPLAEAPLPPPSAEEPPPPATTPEPTPSEPPPPSPPEPTDEVFTIENELRLSVDLPVYPEQEVSETVIELIRMAQVLDRTEFVGMLRQYDGQIRFSQFCILFLSVEPRLSTHFLRLSREELTELSEKYGLILEYLIEIEVVDDYYYGIFAKDAKNISPTYYDATIEDGKLFWFPATSALESYIPILKSQNITENTIELTFSIFNSSMDTLYSNKWTAQIGWIDGDEYVFERDAIDLLATLKYTFILEDGKHKVYAIELV
ncbi:MAG: hypothetical protein LBI19_10335 [Oscillospiraceae bacterium]|jgi:hypothetical protein|nr:hypothetical protein [Oscillospiraceae bacterium]